MLEVIAVTDVGVQRKINEDHFVVDEVHHLYVVCDGMGGHAGGEVASRLGTETLVNFIRTTREAAEVTLPYPWDPALPPEANRLSMAVRLANWAVYDAASKNSGLTGMGSTVVALMIHEGTAYIAHVGDSRLYRLRLAKLEQLTRDDSEINHMIDTGQLHPDDAYKHPEKNIITRALGIDVDVIPTIRMERTREDDIFLLCTDGVSDLISDRKLCELFVQARDVKDNRGKMRLQWACNELVRLANKGGGKDNITAVMVRQT